jgi:hypothetical protein
MQRFLAKGKRLNKVKAHQKMDTKVYGPDLRLTPIVIPPMPLLTGSITGLESARSSHIVPVLLSLEDFAGG